MPHRYFAFSGDEAVSGLTVPADLYYVSRFT